MSNKKLKTTDLTGRVAIVTGGSRGIGREVCIALARLGCSVAILAKSEKGSESLPGSIYTVADEICQLTRNSNSALPIKCDMLNVNDIEQAVDKVATKYGRIDIVVNNASALWWQDIKDTPISKFDLITRLNARGTFALTRLCLPFMEKASFGRVITMSPPIRLDGFKGHTAYNISKYGMTMVALGVAQEYEGTNITGNSLWPATIVESLASINFKMGSPSLWRKATILADAVVGIVCDGAPVLSSSSSAGSVVPGISGRMLIDDTYLRRHHGFVDDDFVQYRCDPAVEPPRLLDATTEEEEQEEQRKKKKEERAFIKRGNVRTLSLDMERSSSVLDTSATTQLPAKL